MLCLCLLLNSSLFSDVRSSHVAMLVLSIIGYKILKGGVASGGMVFIPSLVEIHQLVRRLLRGTH
jgi:hypothetical protein